MSACWLVIKVYDQLQLAFGAFYRLCLLSISLKYTFQILCSAFGFVALFLAPARLIIKNLYSKTKFSLYLVRAPGMIHFLGILSFRLIQSLYLVHIILLFVLVTIKVICFLFISLSFKVNGRQDSKNVGCSPTLRSSSFEQFFSIRSFLYNSSTRTLTSISPSYGSFRLCANMLSKTENWDCKL